MATLQLVLVLLLTVLLSSIIDQILPRVSLPLIQILLGIVIAVFAREQIHITLLPELFIVVFIAPLLFHEARVADNAALWENRRTMVSFAVGLVVAIVLVEGFALKLLAPFVPLACAFALGAALGPTDPLAVQSVSQQAAIPERQNMILKGESLINDASGIVSFQFAIAYVTTGVFSAGEAILSFLYSFFGGLIFGVLIGYVLVKLVDKVRNLGLENTMFHVLFEVCTPFITYLAGEAIGVSGIIMVVACGITMTMVPRDLGPSVARQNIVSQSVWEVLTFALNGIVFVMLGTQLPLSLTIAWEDNGISNFDLVLFVAVLTLLMYLVRFIWSYVSDAMLYRRDSRKIPTTERIRSAAILTLSGAKGAVTLAIMFSIPNWVNGGVTLERFPYRDLLIFLACGVILVSLLLATFIVPILAPRTMEDPTEVKRRDDETRLDIFRAVIEELTARQTKETRMATQQVIARYNDRISRVKAGENTEEDEQRTALRIKVLQWEEEYVFACIDDESIPAIEGYKYLTRLARIKSMLKKDRTLLVSIGARYRHLRSIIGKLYRQLREKLPGEGRETSAKRVRDIQLKTARYIVRRLQNEITTLEFPTELVSELIVEYHQTIMMLRNPTPSIAAIANAAEPDLEITRLGLRIELEQIQLAYEEKRLSRAAAQKMRENVYLMQVDLEDYL